MRREGEKSRGAHPPQGPEELGILVLRLVDQDVDADRMRTHSVERGERPGERGPVKRGAFTEPFERAIIIDDKRNPLVQFARIYGGGS